VTVHSQQLEGSAFFAAMLGPHFREGSWAKETSTLALDEDWTAFKSVLQALYEGGSAELELSAESLRPTLEAADRCDVAPAVEACLRWARRNFSPSMFFDLAPLLHGSVAFASAARLRRTLFGEALQTADEVQRLVSDSRWEELSLGLRQQLLDSLECMVARLPKEATSRSSSGPGGVGTVAAALQRRGEVPGDLPGLRKRYEELDQGCSAPLASEKPWLVLPAAQAAAPRAEGSGGEGQASESRPAGPEPSGSLRNIIAQPGKTASATADVVWAQWTSSAE